MQKLTTVLNVFTNPSAFNIAKFAYEFIQKPEKLEEFSQKSKQANENIASDKCDQGGKVFGGMLNDILNSDSGLQSVIKNGIAK